MTLVFLSIYKKTIVKDVIWYSKTEDYYIYQISSKIYYLETKNNLLLKVIYNKGEKEKCI